MSDSKQFMEHIEYTFSAFCRMVLHNTAISAYRDFGRKQKHSELLENSVFEKTKKGTGKSKL